jgi:hypothetical protein
VAPKWESAPYGGLGLGSMGPISPRSRGTLLTPPAVLSGRRDKGDARPQASSGWLHSTESNNCLDQSHGHPQSYYYTHRLHTLHQECSGDSQLRLTKPLYLPHHHRRLPST